MRSEKREHGSADGSVTLRRLPYPYQAVLAICSDLDETPDRHVYLEIARFLNSTQTTSMGPGVGLEVGNTIYFDMPPDQFAYWTTDDSGRDMVRTLIRSGHIDCLHSYGDLATERRHAERALEELDRHGCRLKVWVDHSRAPSNFGPDIMRGTGDVVGSPVYHADLTCEFGIRFVWRGRTTSVIGQDILPRLGGLLSTHHPLASAKTIAKQATKQCLAWAGSAKYALHGPNRVLHASHLRDGRPVFEFLRSNPHWCGVGEGATAAGLGEVLSDRFLDLLVARGGVCVLYTHLGKVCDQRRPFDEKTCGGLRRLADRYHRGEILVTTASRLLEYLAIRRTIHWSSVRRESGLVIEIDSREMLATGRGPVTENELQGLAFQVQGSVPASVRIQGGPAIDARSATDGTRRILSVPFRRLEFPSI